MIQATYSFSPRTPRIGRLDVVQGTAHLFINKSNPEQIHRLNFQQQTLYFLRQPFAADDGWEVWPATDAKLPLSHLETPLEPTFANWLGSATPGWHLFNILPTGAYYIIRSPLEAQSKSVVYIGNATASDSRNIKVLLDENAVVYANIFCSGVHPQEINQPLLGLVVLNSTGMRWNARTLYPHQHDVWFFPVFPSEEAIQSNAVDLILVVPITGDFIMDNLHLYSKNTLHRSDNTPLPEESELVKWESEYVDAFVASLSRAELPSADDGMG